MLNWHKKRLKGMKKQHEALIKRIAKTKKAIEHIRKEDLRGRPRVYE